MIHGFALGPPGQLVATLTRATTASGSVQATKPVPTHSASSVVGPVHLVDLSQSSHDTTAVPVTVWPAWIVLFRSVELAQSLPRPSARFASQRIPNEPGPSTWPLQLVLRMVIRNV